MRKIILLLFFLLFHLNSLHAACSSPAGVLGQMQYISGEYKYCDNTTWLSLFVTNLGTSCTTAGQWQRAGSDAVFCNGTNWISMVGALDDGACSVAGNTEFDIPNLRFRWCNGSTWKIMQPSSSYAAPSDLNFSHYPNDRNAWATWTVGVGSGMCRLQYLKNDTTWVNLDSNLYNCDSDNLASIDLPTVSLWTNNFNATGVKIRLVSTVTGDSLGEFPQRATCLSTIDPGSSTPNLDENCNGVWDDEPTGLDACFGTPGATCNGGILFVAQHDNRYIMTTPGGCTNSATPTCAGGTDSVMKKWGDSNTQTFLNNKVDGSLQSAILATNYTDTEAAKYCENMTYGGYSDWYLPSTGELVLMSPSNVTLSGIRTNNYYWASTESSPSSGEAYRFSDGYESWQGKATNTYVRCVRSQPMPDPCDYPNIPLGTACLKGTIYAGIFDKNKYFITPAGCDNLNPTTCTGPTDTLTLSWRGSSSTSYNVPAVNNITGATGKSTQQGDVTTPLIALEFGNYSVTDTAAHYCQNMVYQGYSDWYLPSKSELAYIYCHMDVGAHNVSYPNENANCTTYGGKTSELTGFPKTGTPYYWSSSKNSTNGWRILGTTGLQATAAQSNSYLVRCIRKESGPVQVAPTALSLSQPMANSSAVQVSWTAGSGTGGAGGCKLQYLKNGVTWTDALDMSALAPQSVLNCDQTGTFAAYLSMSDGWTNNFDATGVSVRLVHKKTGTIFGTFTQKAVCNPIASSASPSPQVDENCNGIWDDNVGGTSTCTGTQTCIDLGMHIDPFCNVYMGSLGASCTDNSSMTPGYTSMCLPFFAGLYLRPVVSNLCTTGGVFN